ncbi:MAG: hypothetical protein NT154_16405 [Verrucomicrobia bacterium]|nr:hypothetical protein [Verrucomicrobiota bacterium]
MKSSLFKVILVSAVVAACVICRGQVYSVNGKPVVPPPERPGEIVVTTWGFADDGQAIWYASTNTLAKQPPWDGFSAEPPLTIRKACALALPQVRKHYPEIESWSVESVRLCKPEAKMYPDVWCYEIKLMPRDPKLRARIEHQPSSFATQQIVLLDGTVLPIVLRKK